MRVAVTGGREYHDERRVAEALDDLHQASPITLLIHGDASGADRLAAAWADAHGILPERHPANWDDIDTPPVAIEVNRAGRPYNKLAGFSRNIEMLVTSDPDLLVVFPGGSGTAHCHREALKRGIPTLEIDP